MKNMLIIVLSVILLTLSMTGCTKANCCWCGEERYCGTMTVLGEEVPVCRACQQEIEELREELKDE